MQLFFPRAGFCKSSLSSPLVLETLDILSSARLSPDFLCKNSEVYVRGPMVGNRPAGIAGSQEQPFLATSLSWANDIPLRLPR